MTHICAACFARSPAGVSRARFFLTIHYHSTKALSSNGGKDSEWDSALPYSEIPSPNLWHSLKNYKPGGRYHNINLTQLHQLYREDFGDLVRFRGMLGRKDVVMSYQPDDFEKLFRTEGQWPNRRGLDTFVHYRKKIHPDLFKGLGGLVTEQGESWQKFRTIVNPIMLQPKTVQMYVGKLDEVSLQFVKIMMKSRNEKNELPADFHQWLNRWALETMGVLALDTRFGVLDDQESEEAQEIVKTSSAISGILYCLATHPEKQAKLRDELRTILPKKDSPLTPESMRNLPYLRASIKEGMRLYSPVFANLRAAGRDIVLQGYQIPKGTDVGMASMIVQQDDRFISRAKEFLPERWLKQDGYPSIKDAHPFVYLPFGNGPRTCIGRRLAMLEMEILVSRITRLFDYRWNYGELQMKTTLVNTPVNELKFQMVEVDD